MKDVDIISGNFKDAGNVTLSFRNKSDRDQASRLLSQNVTNASVKEIGKRWPKIMIHDVNCQEDNVCGAIMEKNGYLDSVSNIGDKIKVIFSKKNKDGYMNYVVKCDPEVRSLIRKHGEELKLIWGIHRVSDYHMPVICYKCQGYGHFSQKCTMTGDRNCRKCAGKHDVKVCQSQVSKCVNCEANGFHANHRAHARDCKTLQNEIKEIIAKTDHGF